MLHSALLISPITALGNLYVNALLSRAPWCTRNLAWLNTGAALWVAAIVLMLVAAVLAVVAPEAERDDEACEVAVAMGNEVTMGEEGEAAVEVAPVTTTEGARSTPAMVDEANEAGV